MYQILGLFGISVSDLATVNEVTIFLCLIWLIFLLSKVFFERIFTNEIWENLFIFVVGFPTLMQVFYGSIYYLNYLELGSDILDQLFYSYTFIDLDNVFLSLLPLFFIAYLICFIARLKQKKKRKTGGFVESK